MTEQGYCRCSLVLKTKTLFVPNGMPDSQLRQVQLQFQFVEGRIPAYANAVVANSVPEGVIIDFGFFDPLLLKEIQDNFKSGIENEPIVVQATERLILGRQVAEQLIIQIQNALAATEPLTDE